MISPRPTGRSEVSTGSAAFEWLLYPCPCLFKLLLSPVRPGYGALSGLLPLRVRAFHLPNGLRWLKGQKRNDRLKAAGFCEAQRAIRAIQTEKNSRPSALGRRCC